MFGGRHLYALADNKEKWSNFIAALEDIEPFHLNECIRYAKHTFSTLKQLAVDFDMNTSRLG